MPSEPFAQPYEILAQQLSRARTEVGMTQVQLAAQLGISQSTVSKVERGVQRLDLVELREWLVAIGGPSLRSFVADFDERAPANARVQLSWLERRRHGAPSKRRPHDV